ncbi:hypothetical protein JYK14_00340 [Siccirubricoccus sp. KC 17139]|uniref:Uncharacterized protein n=1 Tax=Siccirubricoccus soli TaxID=2899147 RepID=A0ABT1D0S8_9PROT|nr:hypothetical protein [Siccirubricoccus soli]MCO6414630.1 hypothetical protein [Siccirubricoccus soli]MCP2680760.1 hypothetical protein [Siccirubricoccus soli]
MRRLTSLLKLRRMRLPSPAVVRGALAAALVLSTPSFGHSLDFSACWRARPTAEAESWWLFARNWQDLEAAADPREASPFARIGWERVARALATVAQEPETLRALGTGDFRPLLAGADRERYCRGLDAVVGSTAAGTLDVPLQLIEARAVLEALAPVVPDILADLVSRPAPNPGQVEERVRAELGRVTLDRRLGGQLRLLATEVGDAAAWPVSRPDDWPRDQAWPPTRELLLQLSETLASPLQDGLRICDGKQIAVSAQLRQQLQSARALAAKLAGAVSAWSQTCLNAVEEATAARPDLMPGGGLVEPHYIGTAEVPGGAAAQDQAGATPRPALQDIAGSADSYALVLVRESEGRPAETLPLGVVVRNVESVRDDRGIRRPRRYAVNIMSPSIESVRMDALAPTLGRLGLPAFMRLRGARPEISSDFRNISLILEAGVPALGLQKEFELRLVVDGKEQDPHRIIEAIRKDLELEIRQRVDEARLALRLEGIGSPLTLEVQDYRFDAARSAVRINAQFEVPSPSWLALAAGESAAPLRFEAALDIDLLAERLGPKLIAATLPAELLPRFARFVSQRLDALELGRGACVQTFGLEVVQTPSGAIRLVAALKTRDAPVRHSMVIPWSGQPDEVVASVIRAAGLSGEMLAACARDWLLARAGLDVQAWVRGLEGREISLLGLAFVVRNATWEGGVRGHLRANFESRDQQGLRLEGVTVGGGWRPGQPLSARQISFAGVALPPRLVETAMRAVAPGLDKLVSVRGARIVDDGAEADLTLAVPGVADPIAVDAVRLSFSQAGDAFRGALQALLLDAVEREARKLASSLAALGRVRPESIRLARDRGTGRHLSNLHLADPGKGPELVVRAEADVGYGVLLPFLVTLPDFRVQVEDDFNGLVAPLLGSVVSEVASALGGLTLGSGLAVDDVEPLIDAANKRFGVTFTADLKLGDTIGFGARGIVLDRHGLGLPPSFTVAARLPGPVPIPPHFQLNTVGGTLWREPAGRFALSADVAFFGDDPGFLLVLRGTIEGDGPSRVLRTDGHLSILRHIPLFRTRGTVDFNRSRIDLMSETEGPLARILRVASATVIDAGQGRVEGSAETSLLGLRTAGTFSIGLRGTQQAVVSGEARWPGVGTATLGITSGADFRNPSGRGSLDLSAFGHRVSSASVGLDLSKADLSFRAFGAKVRIIAPSVTRIDARVIERAIRALLDFKLDWNALKNRQITINLLDPGGNPTDQAAGGGDPLDGSASEQAERAPAPEPDPRNPNATPPPTPDPNPGTVAGRGNFNWTKVGPVRDHCAERSDHVGPFRTPASHNRATEAEVNLWWLETPVLPGHVFEADVVEQANFAWLNGSWTRIASRAVYEASRNGTVVDCFDVADLPYQSFHFPDIGGPAAESSQVAVVAPADGEPRLQVLVFRYQAEPLGLPLPSGADRVIFDSDLATARRNGWRMTEVGGHLLRTLAEAVARKDREWTVQRVHSLPPSDLVPGWRLEPAYVLDRLRYDNVREISIERPTLGGLPGSKQWRNSPPPAADFYRILEREPSGPIARLLAAAPRFDRDLRLLTDRESRCALLQATAPGGLFLVALHDQRHGVVLLTRPRTVAGDAHEDALRLLRSLCDTLAGWGRDSELVLGGASTAGEVPIAAGRYVIDDRTAIWWLAWPRNGGPTPRASDGSSPVERRCLGEPELIDALNKNGDLVRDSTILNWSSANHRRQMLSILAGQPSDWAPYFRANPRGVFLARAQPGSCQ